MLLNELLEAGRRMVDGMDRPVPRRAQQHVVSDEPRCARNHDPHVVIRYSLFVIRHSLFVIRYFFPATAS
jgi:hypothetical protein